MINRFFRILITAVVILSTLVVSVFFFVQTSWAKDKIGLLLQETALQQGIPIKIGRIEGTLPLKWHLSEVHLQLNATDSIHIDSLRLRLSLLGLIRGELSISYLSAQKAVYQFVSKQRDDSSFSPLALSCSIRALKLKEVEVINLNTGEKATYSVAGNGHFAQQGKEFTLSGKIQSTELNAELFLQGDESRDQISTDLYLHVKSARAFAPFGIFPFDTAFNLQTQCTGPWKVWKSFLAPSTEEVAHPIRGKLTLDVDKLALPALQGLDENLVVHTHFALYSNQTLALSSLTLKSDLLCIKGDAEFDRKGIPQSLACTFLIPHLSHLVPTLEGIAQGEIRYNEERCDVEIKSDRIDLRKVSFTDSRLTLHANERQNVWTGSIDFSTLHPELGLEGKSGFTLNPDQFLQLQNLSLQGTTISLQGDVGFQIPTLNKLQGGCIFQLRDLSPYSQLLAYVLKGQMGGQIDFKGEDIRCQALAKNVQVENYSAEKASLDLFVTDISQQIKGKIEVETHHAFASDAFIESLFYSMGRNNDGWNYSLQSQGEWKKPFTLSSEGNLIFTPEQFQLHCDTLKGTLFEKSILLEKPFNLSVQRNELSLTDFQMKIDNGSVISSIRWNPGQAQMRFQAHHFPLDFVTLLSHRLSLQGLSSIDIELEGSNHDLQGHLNLLLEHADIFQTGNLTPIQTKGSLQANISDGVAQLHSRLVASGEQFFEFSASFPLSYQHFPLQITLHPQQTIAGQCTVEGHLEQLFDFINLGTQRLGGFLSCHLFLSGTPEKPLLFGPLSLQDGFYQNYFIGMDIQGVNLGAEAQGSTIVAEGIEAQDGDQGTSISKAVFHLEPRLPFFIEGSIDHFRVVQFDWLAAACSGPFKITGTLDQGLVEGSLVVDEAEIKIPEQLPSNIPVLPVTFIHQPVTHKLPTDLHLEPYPFHYDLNIVATDNIRLAGRGLNADLQGKIHLTGKNLTVTAVGSLQTKKGKFSFAGKDFNITQGELNFSDSGNFLNITSTAELSDLMVTVLFRGNLTAPELTFQSNPPLPTSSILARILFNKDVSELSATQALQLANTIVTLASNSGPNVMETIRQNLGIDRLSFSASEETGQISVQIGKELAKGVMVTLSQSTESSQVIVEVELKGGFVLQAETQEDDQGKFSFKWNKNY